MLRYIACAAMLLLAIALLKSAARLLFTAHRLSARHAAPMPVEADAIEVPERYDVRMSIAEIWDRTLH